MDKLKENFFQILGLPESLNLTSAAIRKAYYSKSREYHPDHFSGQSNAEQTKVLLKSELINLAYKVISDENLRMKHVLELYGMMDGQDQASLPHEFLFDMMELNESLEAVDVSNADVRANVESILQTIESDLKDEVNPWVEKFESGVRTSQVLEGIRDYYLKSKYLLRIKENMATFADRNQFM